MQLWSWRSSSLRTFTDGYLIMLLARAEEVDKLVGLSVGSDDHVTKPFSPRELVARIRTPLPRPRSGRAGSPGGFAMSDGGEPGVRRFGALSVDPPAREVDIDGEPVPLMRTELDMFTALAPPGPAHGASFTIRLPITPVPTRG